MGSRIKVGLVGWPVSHSLSPFMHNEAFKFYNMNWIYELIPVKEEEFDSKIEEIKKEYVGFNVTIPYKKRIIEHLDKLSEEAEKIGAVNTVKKENEKFIGYNTDVLGFIEDLKANDFNVKGKNALILGCGGAGNAVLFGLISLGVKKIYLYDISKERSVSLKDRGISYLKEIEVIEGSNLKNVISNIEILVNATPCGMKEGDLPPINLDYLNKNISVYDLIYNRETELVKKAKSTGVKAVSGWGMLLHQGRIAWEIWTGKKAPKEIMKKALLEKLGIE